MRFSGIALPMRCQPPHYGHLKCITTAARLAEEVRVFLCRDYETADDPFPFALRRRWLEQMIGEASLSNVSVVDRTMNQPSDRLVEYRSAFAVESIVVFTTHETDEMYRQCGFATFNHHDPENAVALYGEVPTDLHSTGRIIRSRLRIGLSCESFLPSWLEWQAREYLQAKT